MPLDFTETLKSWRHHLHAHPELSLRESETAAFVCRELEALGVPYEAGIGGHGVVATISRGASNRAVGLRADMDALPITEATGVEYASKHSGVMHACGHDGHTASLLGAARLLAEDKGWTGTVHLVFQPAEEGFGGAAAMLKDGLLRRFPMERIFGYHNWPGLETGTVMLHDGPLMAAAGNFNIMLRGHAAHAAMPHLGRDPVQAAAHLILAMNAIVARNVDPLDTAVISVTKMQGAQANNQIPDVASIGGTFRAHDEKVMAFLEARMRDCADAVAAMFGLTAEVKFSGYLPPTTNHKAEADLAADAASALGLHVRRDMKPTMGAEDFGRFLLEIPGSYAWIGNGDSAGLHNEKFNYNDEILPIAANYLAAVAKAALTA
jgi:hippurate hydrolase